MDQIKPIKRVGLPTLDLVSHNKTRSFKPYMFSAVAGLLVGGLLMNITDAYVASHTFNFQSPLIVQSPVLVKPKTLTAPLTVIKTVMVTQDATPEAKKADLLP